MTDIANARARSYNNPAKQEETKPAWATHSLRKSNAGRTDGLSRATRGAQNAVSEGTKDDKKANASKSLSRGLAALLERDQSYSIQNLNDKPEEKEENSNEIEGDRNEQAKPENPIPNSTTQRTVYKAPQLQQVKTGCASEEAKPGNSKTSSSTHWSVYKAPQVQQVKTGCASEEAKPENSETSSSTHRSVYKAPQVQQVKTGCASEEAKPENSKTSSSTHRSVYKAPQVQQVKTGCASEEAKPENSKTSSSTHRSVYKAPQVQQVKTGFAGEEAKLDNSKPSSSTQRIVHKAPQVQQVQTGLMTDHVAKPISSQSDEIVPLKKAVHEGRVTQLKPATQTYVAKSPVIVHGRKGGPAGNPDATNDGELIPKKDIITSSIKTSPFISRKEDEEIEPKVIRNSAIKMVNGVHEAKSSEGYEAKEPDIKTTSADQSETIRNDEETVEFLKKEIERIKAEHEREITNYQEKINEMKIQLESETSSDRSTSSPPATSPPPPPPPPPPGPAVPTPPPPPPPPGSMSSPPPPPPVPGVGPPPPPPPIGSGARRFGGLVKPKKAAVKPDVEMKPLFWTRILISDEADGGDMNNNKNKITVWKNLQEMDFKRKEFQKLFGRKITKKSKHDHRKSLHDDSCFSISKGQHAAKLLDNGRSQTIGIIMSSLNCELADIKDAVYKMDTSVIDMDGLKALYDIRPKSDEIEMITKHQQENPNVPLDKPEEFLLQIHRMDHFAERLECWLYRNKFTETLTVLDRRLSAICEASSLLHTNKEVSFVLSIILTLGNFMNGGTNRGQADGFQLSVLNKIKDVKTQDNNTNLMQYIVQVYCDKRQGGERGDFLLPDPYAILAASQVSFKDIKAELAEAKISLATCKAKSEMVLGGENSSHREPFQSFVNEYLRTGQKELTRMQEKVQSTMEDFKEVVDYFQYSGEGEEVTPPLIFGIWGNFLEAFKNYWKAEQINLAKRTFCNTEHLKQIRATATKFRKRRTSDAADPNEAKSRTKTS